MENAIEVTNLSKHYSKFSLDRVNLNLPRGYVMGLIGPNGAGKTTLIRTLMGVLKQDSGSIHLLGQDMSASDTTAKNHIGFVYDDFPFYQDRFMKTLARVFALSYSSWDWDQYYENLERFGLPRNKQLRNLSRGMRMKFSLALALSHKAELILMDEPTAGLDPVFRRELLTQLSDILIDERCAVLFSTHITSDLDRIADYIAVLRQGQLVLSTSLSEIEDNWGIVRTSDWKPDNSLPVLGIRREPHGVEVLTDNRRTLTAALSGDFVVEKPSIEDVLVHLSKGGHDA